MVARDACVCCTPPPKRRAMGLIIGLGVAACVNLLLFLGIPFLTHVDTTAQKKEYDQGILLAARKPPPPPEPPRETPKELEKEKPPEMPPKLATPRKRPPAPKPRMQVQAPSMQFAVNSRLAQGMAVAAPTAAPPPPPVKTAFEIGEVDTPPKLTRSIPPVYPFAAKRQRITGKVVVRMLVSTKGQVSRVSIVSSNPKGVFDDAVKNAVNKWRFAPGVLDGKPVATWVVAPINFNL